MKELIGRITEESRHRHEVKQDAPSANDANVSTTEYRPAESGEPPADVTLTLSTDYFRSVVQVMADAAEAMQHAHDVGYIHRDLKPSNLMVDASGQCFVIDFGLAGYLAGGEVIDGPEDIGPEAGKLTDGYKLGTLNYMAPEQINGHAEARSDVWGLGATLYELCTLRQAFGGESPEEVQEKIVGAEPRPPRELVANIPADLAAVCDKALQKDPGDRYQTPGELAADLRCFLAGRPTTARPPPLWEVAWMWAKRRPAVATLTAVTSVVMLAVGLLTLAYLVRERAFADEMAHKERQERLHVQRAMSKSTVDVAHQFWVTLSLGRRQGAADVEKLEEQALEQTIQSLEQLGELAADDPDTLAERGQAYLLLGLIRARTGDLDRALADATRCSRLCYRPRRLMAMLGRSWPTPAVRGRRS